MDTTTEEIFIRNFTNALWQGEAAIFAGAGLSCEAGFVNWKNLLRNMASDIRLNIDKENDLISVAQYYLNESGGNRYSINEEIINQFSKNAKETETLNIIAALPISTYWTTNYDHIIEDTLRNGCNKIVDVKITQDNLANNVNNRDVVVFKFHGDKDYPNDAVLTKDDYEMFSLTHNLFITALKGDLVSKTFAFVGYGINDPDFLQILSNIRILLGKNAREHYCFIKKVNRDKYKDNKEYEYDKLKQNLYINDIKRYGIKAILLDEYSEIKVMFEKIRKRFLSNRIFIAGSCRDYDSWDANIAYNFMYKLGYKLIKENNKISTGLIEGVGPQIVSGVLTAINEENFQVEKYLSIKTLPLINGKATHINNDAKKMFQDNMISEVGIVLFLFGNQYYDGVLKSSKGVMNDFSRAKSQNKYIIPVGSTGFAALKILNEIEANIAEYPYLKNYLFDLRYEKTPEKLIDVIINIINDIKSLN